ncbi:hypothetical protein [Serinibacter arcticus]|uniref:hypothetical protein n=1 Tax=Serinibacter arcticus TaxID=1655435 RepID=UPI0011B2767E|nr:hypothetical protein [Serinibacter arcticus]
MTSHSEDDGRHHITPHSWQGRTMLGYALGDHSSDDARVEGDEPGPAQHGGSIVIRARTWYLLGTGAVIVLGVVLAIVVSS